MKQIHRLTLTGLIFVSTIIASINSANAGQIRMTPQAGVTDYSEQLNNAVAQLAQAGGGRLVIAPGRYPVFKHVRYNFEDKAVAIEIVGEKDTQGRFPVLYDTDIARDPHHFFLFEGTAEAPRYSISINNLELQGNNVPRDASKATTPFMLDEGQTDMEPNPNLPRDQSYGHPFFFRGDIYSAAIRATNIHELHVDNVIVRNLFGNGILVANYGNKLWERQNRAKKVSITNSQLHNVWQWHNADNTGDGIMLWNVSEGLIENNQVINDVAHTRWVGRCGIVLETNTENVIVRNNTVSGYCRNVHIELTFGGHQVVGNKLLASDIGVILNEPDSMRPDSALPFTKTTVIANNIMEYAQERERYGIHSFGGPRAFIYVTSYRSQKALGGTKILNNQFRYRVHKGVKINRWREDDVKRKSKRIYIDNHYAIGNWIERNNTFR